MKWMEEHVMDREKNHILLVNINQSSEKKKMNQERTRDLMIIEKIKKKIVSLDRVNMSQP
jgi:hypothetical protein